MRVVVKLVNVHFEWCKRKVKWSFSTMYDNSKDCKSYAIIAHGRVYIVTKERGNAIFRALKEHFPEQKRITIINSDPKDVMYVRVNEHYEVRLNGAFVESCESVQEARISVERIRAKLSGVTE